MKLKFLICILLSMLLLTGCTSFMAFPSRVKSESKISRPNISIAVNDLTLGSPSYIKRVGEIARKSGSKVALYRVILDVEKNGAELDKNPGNALSLYKMVSQLVYKIGYVDMKTHYFRNDLNRAPENLEDLLALNSSLPASQRWRLLPVKSSLYHMQGKNGIYNLKFVSPEGFCEAVYNKKGVLLTEKNDPVNMGTFNYAAGISVKGAHQKFDVDPYLSWGNAKDSPQKGKAEIGDSITLVKKLYKQSSTSVAAYRSKVMRNITKKPIL